MEEKSGIIETNLYDEKKQRLENESILKYEKNAKPYRKTYIPTVKNIVCQKCGSPYTLTKHIVDGKEYWFCKRCLAQKMMEIRNQRKREDNVCINR